ncbi:MAG: immunoglobulin domain-containing protein, partial [Bacteroidota bacterium]|nr:immunoglobulin domain-containing protein [Bacteroidota bacterium]
MRKNILYIALYFLFAHWHQGWANILFNLNNIAAPVTTPVTTYVVPVITSQPASVTVNSGENASFTVAATGDGLTYQWQVDTGNGSFANITNGGVYSGATTATLTITNVPYSMNNYTYRVQVSDGMVVTSENAILTVTKQAPVITQTEITLPAIAEDLAKEQNQGGIISSLFAGAVSSPEGMEIGIAITGR